MKTRKIYYQTQTSVGSIRASQPSAAGRVLIFCVAAARKHVFMSVSFIKAWTLPHHFPPKTPERHLPTFDVLAATTRTALLQN